MVKTVPTSKTSSDFQKVSVEDYTDFHAMLCGPKRSKGCIDSFTGCAVFASQEEYDEISSGNDNQSLAAVDYNAKPVPLNLFSYYLLVIVSFTGLCTLLGATKVMLVRDENEIFTNNHEKEGSNHEKGMLVTSHSHPNLSLPSRVIGYIQQRSQAIAGAEKPPERVTLTRRFEIQFADYLSVMMCHFVCSHGQKHLVEVYSVKPGVFSKVASLIVWLTKASLNLAGKFVQKPKQC